MPQDSGSKKELSAGKISTWSAQAAGGNLLLSLFSDSDAVLRGRALEVFVRRSYRACGVSGSSHLAVATQGPGIMGARWRFRNPGVAVAGTMSVWQGSAKVLPHSKALEEYL
ncbi:unnamed protein product, partial [Cladocopium goreaui]